METEQPKQPRSGLAIAGLVLGIIALVTSLMPIINNMSFFAALVGAVLAIVMFRIVKQSAWPKWAERWASRPPSPTEGTASFMCNATFLCNMSQRGRWAHGSAFAQASHVRDGCNAERARARCADGVPAATRGRGAAVAHPRDDAEKLHRFAHWPRIRSRSQG